MTTHVQWTLIPHQRSAGTYALLDMCNACYADEAYPNHTANDRPAVHAVLPLAQVRPQLVPAVETDKESGHTDNKGP